MLENDPSHTNSSTWTFDSDEDTALPLHSLGRVYRPKICVLLMLLMFRITSTKQLSQVGQKPSLIFPTKIHTSDFAVRNFSVGAKCSLVTQTASLPAHHFFYLKDCIQNEEHKINDKPVWIRTWRSSWLGFWNLLSQNWQTWKPIFSFWAPGDFKWVFMCSFKWLFLLNDFWHT